MLSSLISKILSRESTATVNNQYKNKHCLDNLTKYLNYIFNITKISNNKYMLVGEAPGYRGCAITGIPFTSIDIIKNKPHQIFRDITFDLGPDNSITYEYTASVIWDVFKNVNILPLFWNVFPFHPHLQNNLLSNRTPNKEEILEGEEFLKDIVNMYNPKFLYGIGKISYNSLIKLFPDKIVKYVRHPSHGGSELFKSFFTKIYNL